MQVEGYQVVYSTLAGEQYDKVIVPRNEGATTKTTLNGKSATSLSHWFTFRSWIADNQQLLGPHLHCDIHLVCLYRVLDCVACCRIMLCFNTWLTFYWSYSLECLLSWGHIERLSEKWGQLALFLFFIFSKRSHCWKGHGQRKKIKAKGPRFIQLGCYNRCFLRSRSSADTLHFPSPWLSLSFLLIVVTVSTVFSGNWLETHQFCHIVLGPHLQRAVN